MNERKILHIICVAIFTHVICSWLKYKGFIVLLKMKKILEQQIFQCLGLILPYLHLLAERDQMEHNMLLNAWTIFGLKCEQYFYKEQCICNI